MNKLGTKQKILDNHKFNSSKLKTLDLGSWHHNPTRFNFQAVQKKLEPKFNISLDTVYQLMDWAVGDIKWEEKFENMMIKKLAFPHWRVTIFRPPAYYWDGLPFPAKALLYWGKVRDIVLHLESPDIRKCRCNKGVVFALQ